MIRRQRQIAELVYLRRGRLSIAVQLFLMDPFHRTDIGKAGEKVGHILAQGGKDSIQVRLISGRFEVREILWRVVQIIQRDFAPRLGPAFAAAMTISSFFPA